MKSKSNVKITTVQLFTTLTGFIFGSTVLMNPATQAKEDSWLAFIIGWAGGLVLIYVYLLISKYNPNKTLVEILIDNFGKYIGTVVSILYIMYFVHLASLVLRNFGEFSVTVTYQETPQVVIISLLALLVAYAVRGGLEVAARINLLLFPVIPVGIFLISLALLSYHDTTAMFPVLKNGIFPVLNAGFAVMAFPFGEVVAFLMLFPFVNATNKVSKVSFLSVIIGGAVLLLVLLRDLAALGPDLIANTNYPGHMTSRLIPFISVEPLVDLNFMVGGGIKISVLIFAATYGISQILKTNNYKPLVLAVTSFAVVLSIWVYNNAMDMFRWASKIYPYYALPFQVIIPLVLLGVSMYGKRSNKAS